MFYDVGHIMKYEHNFMHYERGFTTFSLKQSHIAARKKKLDTFSIELHQ